MEILSQVRKWECIAADEALPFITRSALAYRKVGDWIEQCIEDDAKITQTEPRINTQEITLEIAQMAIDHWGDGCQTSKAIEELAELIRALVKDSYNPKLDILDELVDVDIMCTQLRLILKITHLEYETHKISKLVRLKERIVAEGEK
jgi:hypothetical protein